MLYFVFFLGASFTDSHAARTTASFFMAENITTDGMPIFGSFGSFFGKCNQLTSACSGKLDEAFKDMLCRASVVKYNFPSTTNRISSFCSSDEKQKEVVQNALDTRPIVHPRVMVLLTSYLQYKQEHGSKVEVDTYRQMEVSDLVSRLMTKRPLAFAGEDDMFLLRDGTLGRGVDSDFKFDDIGTDKEKAPLLFRDYLSYEEMELAALMAMSTPTPFINDGGRNNRCVESKGDYLKQGILVGLVGCRFERKELMEWKQMIVTKSQNTVENGYGENTDKGMLLGWAKLYGVDHLPTYDEVIKDTGSKRYVKLRSQDAYLDADVYKARCEIIAEMFLAEANERAGAAQGSAFCHVVGLGLGVWRVHEVQNKIQIQAYITVARRMRLPHVGVLFFSYFGNCGSICESANVSSKDGNEIQVIFGNRNPSATIRKEDFGDKKWVLLAQYAWDGNSYPGNEYWLGSGYFAASGDPAAACSSYMPELQNPDINVDAFKKERILVLPKNSTAAAPELEKSPPTRRRRKHSRSSLGPRPTERQTDRQTVRQTHRPTDRQTERPTNKRLSESYRRTDDKQKTDRETDKQKTKDRPTDGRSSRPTGPTDGRSYGPTRPRPQEDQPNSQTPAPSVAAKRTSRRRRKSSSSDKVEVNYTAGDRVKNTVAINYGFAILPPGGTGTIVSVAPHMAVTWDAFDGASTAAVLPDQIKKIKKDRSTSAQKDAPHRRGKGGKGDASSSHGVGASTTKKRRRRRRRGSSPKKTISMEIVVKDHNTEMNDDFRQWIVNMLNNQKTPAVD